MVKKTLYQLYKIIAIISMFFAFFISVQSQTTLPADYPGISLAYSLRQIKSDYAGALIQVAKWDGVSETTHDIDQINGQIDYASLKSFLENVQANEEAYIKVWYDQSGNGVDAIQTDRTKAPKMVINEGVKLFFDGDDFLIPSGPNPSFTDFSLFAYVEPTSLGAAENVLIKGGAVNDRVVLTSPSKAVIFGTSTATNTITSTTTLNGSTLVNVARTGVNSRLYINGFFDVSGNVGNTPFQVSEMGGQNFAGYIYEIVIYNNTANDAQITTNIINYWQRVFKTNADNVQGITAYTHPLTGDSIIYSHTTSDGETIMAAALWALVFFFVYVRIIKTIKGR